MSKKSVKILAIETSCDETAASVLSGALNSKLPQFKFLSSVIKSQIKIHRKTGGIVPEVAARQHISAIQPVVTTALKNADCKLDDINYIAVTSGPGLIVSLIVGVEFAKGLAAGANLPLIPTNHMAGHLYSSFATSIQKQTKTKDRFPALAIIVSGGHTMFLLMKDYHKYKLLGQTLDDAAGEAFDKVARLLKLPYPGGPEISKLAKLGKADLLFPRPMLNESNYNFSFAGLKTAVLYYLNKQAKPLTKQHKANVAMSFENAVVDVLTKKAERAIQKYNCQTIMLSGGVAANTALRESLTNLCEKQGLDFKVPSLEMCGDNAQMIALAAYFYLRGGGKAVKPSKVLANPAWELI